MVNDHMHKVREIAQRIREERKGKEVDFKEMTAPCGLPCFECYMNMALENEEIKNAIAEMLNISPGLLGCRGCRKEGGKLPNFPDNCRVYPCAQNKEFHNCSECGDFPCDFLHPYCDNAVVWHNTKVFNLCLIKKMGLGKWAAEKAGDVLDKYSYDTWKL